MADKDSRSSSNYDLQRDRSADRRKKARGSAKTKRKKTQAKLQTIKQTNTKAGQVAFDSLIAMAQQQIASSSQNQQPYNTQYAYARSFGSSSSQPVCSIKAPPTAKEKVQETNQRYAAMHDDQNLTAEEPQRKMNLIAAGTDSSTRNAYTM